MTSWMAPHTSLQSLPATSTLCVCCSHIGSPLGQTALNGHRGCSCSAAAPCGTEIMVSPPSTDRLCLTGNRAAAALKLLLVVQSLW